MSNSDKIQSQTPQIEGTVNEDMLTVQYWRERLSEKSSQFSSVRDIAEKIGVLDSSFEGVKGYFKVNNAHNNRAGLKVTARVVVLMEQYLLAEEANTE